MRKNEKRIAVSITPGAEALVINHRPNASLLYLEVVLHEKLGADKLSHPTLAHLRDNLPGNQDDLDRREWNDVCDSLSTGREPIPPS